LNKSIITPLDQSPSNATIKNNATKKIKTDIRMNISKEGKNLSTDGNNFQHQPRRDQFGGVFCKT